MALMGTVFGIYFKLIRLLIVNVLLAIGCMKGKVRGFPSTVAAE